MCREVYIEVYREVYREIIERCIVRCIVRCVVRCVVIGIDSEYVLKCVVKPTLLHFIVDIQHIGM